MKNNVPTVQKIKNKLYFQPVVVEFWASCSLQILMCLRAQPASWMTMFSSFASETFIKSDRPGKDQSTA